MRRTLADEITLLGTKLYSGEALEVEPLGEVVPAVGEIREPLEDKDGEGDAE